MKQKRWLLSSLLDTHRVAFDKYAIKKLQDIYRNVNFYRLVHILQPEVILCLGRKTFEGVLSAFGMDSPIMGLSYNSFIERRKPISIAVEGGASVTVFPLAHCGSLGTMNRNANCGKSSTDLTQQKEDWDYINKYL